MVIGGTGGGACGICGQYDNACRCYEFSTDLVRSLTDEDHVTYAERKAAARAAEADRIVKALDELAKRAEACGTDVALDTSDELIVAARRYVAGGE